MQRIPVRASTASYWRQLAVGCAVWLSLMMGPVARPAGAAAYPAEAVKAVFLYRFTGYVQWPAPAMASPQFTIAVIGADDVAAQLRALLREHSIQGKAAQVLTVDSVRQILGAQMLYIGPDYDRSLRGLIAALRDRPVLIVTDQPGGLEAGGTVNFVIDNEHVRFEVSTVAARQAGLKISSDLLAVAERVKTGGLQVPVACRPLVGHPARCPLRVASQ